MKYMILALLLPVISGCYTVIRTSAVVDPVSEVTVEVIDSEEWNYYEGDAAWWESSLADDEAAAVEQHNYGRRRSYFSSPAPSPVWTGYGTAFVISNPLVPSGVSYPVVTNNSDLQDTNNAGNNGNGASSGVTSSDKAAAKSQARPFNQRSVSTKSKKR